MRRSIEWHAHCARCKSRASTPRSRIISVCSPIGTFGRTPAPSTTSHSTWPGGVVQRLLDEEAAVSGSPADLEEVGRVAGGVPQEGIEYARDLIGGVLRHREEIDKIIQERAPAWPLRQMSAVDRTVLRLGLY